MFSESISPLGNNLIIISLVGFTALVIVQIMRAAILRSLVSLMEVAGSDVNLLEIKKKRVKALMKIVTLIVTIATLITLVVFLFFMGNGSNNEASTKPLIKQAPLPKDFKAPSKIEIEKVNEQATQDKSNEVNEEASEANNRAMDEGINIFKKSK